jgi:hypothetical protein
MLDEADPVRIYWLAFSSQKVLSIDRITGPLYSFHRQLQCHWVIGCTSEILLYLCSNLNVDFFPHLYMA